MTRRIRLTVAPELAGRRVWSLLKHQLGQLNEHYYLSIQIHD